MLVVRKVNQKLNTNKNRLYNINYFFFNLRVLNFN